MAKPSAKKSENKETFNQDSPTWRPLSKSRFKLALECPTKLFYDGKSKYPSLKQDDTFLRALAKGGFQVGKLAQCYFPGGVEITTRNYDEALAETEKHLKQDRVVIYEAAFKFTNHFVRADIVEKIGNTLMLYEVKAKGWNPDDSFWLASGNQLESDTLSYLYDVAFQHYVISAARPDLNVIPHLYLTNKRAVTSVEGLNQKFRIVRAGNSYRVAVDRPVEANDLGNHILVPIDVRQEVGAIITGTDRKDSMKKRGNRSFSEWTDFLAGHYLKDQKIPPTLSTECKHCEFRIPDAERPNAKSGFDECWSEAAKTKDTDQTRPRVFDLWNFRSAQKLIDGGLYYIDELHEEDIAPKKAPAPDHPGLSDHERRLLQLEATKNPKMKAHFDKKGYAEIASNWNYPLHFIDFETAMVAIPFNKGRRPYEQIAFQFSHHTAEANGKIAHAGQWICVDTGKFPNFDFLRALKKELEQDDGTIFRYAAHENTVLCQIYVQLMNSQEPDREDLCRWIETIAQPTAGIFAAKLNSWSPRREMVDMLDLVKWFYYHPMMGGSNSIKGVLPAILNSSEFIKRKYSQPIYGTKDGIASKNFKDWQWVQKQTSGVIDDPYAALPKVFPDMDLDRKTLDHNFGDELSELGDGGAAMIAYCRLQFSDLDAEKREYIRNALLRYCELDTLAMAMIWEAWKNA